MVAATATSRRAAPKPAVLAERRKIAQQRLDLEIKLAPAYKTMADLDAKLKKFATDADEPFKEDFGGKGSVGASGAVAAELKGEVPVIQSEAWLTLKEIERKRLIKSGLVNVEEQWARQSSGRVTVKVL